MIFVELLFPNPKNDSQLKGRRSIDEPNNGLAKVNNNVNRRFDVSNIIFKNKSLFCAKVV